MLSKLKSFAKNFIKRNIGLLVAMIMLLIVLFFFAPAFFRVQNISNMFRTLSVNLLLTFGMSFCLIIGGIDLAVGQTVAISGVVTTLGIIANFNWIVAILLGILIGGMIGFANGLVIVFTDVPPFIATIAMQSIIRGAAFILGKGSGIMVQGESFYNYANGNFGGIIPNPVAMTIVIGFLCFLILERTAFGAHMYALGGNENAARFSGINVRKVKLNCYVACGLMSGLAGTIMSSRLMSGHPNIGSGYEADAIAAAVIGGVSFTGGRGTVGGAVLGAIFIGIMINGLNVWGLNSYWQYFVKGSVVLIAILLDLLVISRRNVILGRTKAVN
jgi:ribose transport system permease protein